MRTESEAFDELMSLTKQRLVQFRPFTFAGRNLAIFKYHPTEAPTP